MNRKTLTLIIALVCAVVFVLGCTGTSGKNPSTAAPTEQAQLPTEAPDYSDLYISICFFLRMNYFCMNTVWLVPTMSRSRSLKTLS